MRKIALMVWSFWALSMGVGLCQDQGQMQKQKQPSVNLDTIYGKANFTDPLLIQLATSKIYARLRGVDVAGPSRYLRLMPSYSMFEHAFGVLALLIRYNRPIQEQRASLLSFVAFTAFGDFGSFMFDTKGRDIFQLDTQRDFLKRTGLDKLLSHYNFNDEMLDPTQSAYPAISRSAPELSAQSIDETLRMGFAYKMIDREGIANLMQDLRFEKNKWFFTNGVSAEKFARIALYFAENFWGSENTYLVNRWMGQALKRAIDLGRLRVEDMRFGIDQNIIKTLLTIKDPTINTLLKMASNPVKYYKIVREGPFELAFQTPFKALNPLVQKGGDLVPLTEMDQDFKEAYLLVREKIAKGFRITMVKRSPFGERQSDSTEFGFTNSSNFTPFQESTTYIDFKE